MVPGEMAGAQGFALDNSFARETFTVTIVGCGGTGGFVAEGLCRLLPREATLALVDHDRVEGRNLRRQNFVREDLGRFKSEALAQRLARKYGRAAAYSTVPVAMSKINLPGLVIGCVDNGLARRDIAELVAGGLFMMLRSGASPWPTYQVNWWVDTGNGEDYGQIVIGNAFGEIFEGDRCLALPLPVIQRPELLHQAPRERSCADMEEQGPVINQVMASLVVEVVRRLIEGTCPWKQLYLDLKAGTLTPIMARPKGGRK